MWQWKRSLKTCCRAHVTTLKYLWSSRGKSMLFSSWGRLLAKVNICKMFPDITSVHPRQGPGKAEERRIWKKQHLCKPTTLTLPSLHLSLLGSACRPADWIEDGDEKCHNSFLYFFFPDFSNRVFEMPGSFYFYLFIFLDVYRTCEWANSVVNWFW